MMDAGMEGDLGVGMEPRMIAGIEARLESRMENGPSFYRVGFFIGPDLSFFIWLGSSFFLNNSLSGPNSGCFLKNYYMPGK